MTIIRIFLIIAIVAIGIIVIDMAKQVVELSNDRTTRLEQMLDEIGDIN